LITLYAVMGSWNCKQTIVAIGRILATPILSYCYIWMIC
jgi:hypothetical protein